MGTLNDLMGMKIVSQTPDRNPTEPLQDIMEWHVLHHHHQGIKLGNIFRKIAVDSSSRGPHDMCSQRSWTLPCEHKWTRGKMRQLCQISCLTGTKQANYRSDNAVRHLTLGSPFICHISIDWIFFNMEGAELYRHKQMIAHVGEWTVVSIFLGILKKIKMDGRRMKRHGMDSDSQSSAPD